MSTVITNSSNPNAGSPWASVSLANNTARTPSTAFDTDVIITPNLPSNIGATSSMIVQIDNAGNGVFTTYATSTNTNSLTVTLGLLGGGSTQVQPISLTVPRGCQYRYVLSGSATVLHHYERML